MGPSSKSMDLWGRKLRLETIAFFIPLNICSHKFEMALRVNSGSLVSLKESFRWRPSNSLIGKGVASPIARVGGSSFHNLQPLWPMPSPTTRHKGAHTRTHFGRLEKARQRWELICVGICTTLEGHHSRPHLHHATFQWRGPFNGEDLRAPLRPELQLELDWQEEMAVLTKGKYS